MRKWGTDEGSQVEAIKTKAHLSHQLGVDFGDTVDGARPLHAEIRRGVTRRGGTEGTDGAGDEETQAVLCCNVQDVVKP